MSTPHEVIRARLKEHDDKELLDCVAHMESLECCVDKKIFDFETHEWKDNPFRIALDALLDRDTIPKPAKILSEGHKTARLYDADDVLLGVFPVRQRVISGDRISLDFTVSL